ncbi:phosphonoacetate hydrolase [Pseudomonas gingeri]|uniref:Phosphonoacetate hydrolase n=1 Tax=Pseudomonas gingeri TaxID=117681 RepID=A0A7Y7YFZ3_9PSED|nr:phosphonoacetate hydrolase [Pseudomonas gingeri]NWB27991.1 phosphonoacetate hydrolase [Pseudomonas gingeri]NWC35515.1 phosphonoacetate hydrolase [Pseudomonas gingeri]NWD04615.1 phosphonoacetate hydrolase [Pseudomonas gingeri]NWD50385.1 phosphonoacetate hydrolase [Pseudomonas gingeri]NWE31019.1 phosphonoacetate hydrolase [Pseudomonas gingeri]
MNNSITLHQRQYALPTQPVVVVCIDGCDPQYIVQGIADGVCPTIARFHAQGFAGTADCVMPSFTNPNNVSIVTGAPPEVHGIAGNYYLDRETGKEIMMTDASLLRGETLLALLSQAGIAVAAITAKDKLRKVLGHHLKGICFSSEKAGTCTLEEHGIDDVQALVGRPLPDMYSGDLSLFVLDAGLALLKQKRARVLYLSLSDYIQHKFAPGTQESNEFLKAIDDRLQAFIDEGAIVGCVADHGMSDKNNTNGTPNIIFLQDKLEERFGTASARVICPITDPFVRHHGALGSFVRVYAKDPADIEPMIDYISGLSGIEETLSRRQAAVKLGLPEDREADIVVISSESCVLGSSAGEHDLSTVGDRPLRSHGGYSEQPVPFLLSHPLNETYLQRAASTRLRNFDIFDFALNGVHNTGK